jgi:glycosyltransferase involved in cell wall biosynthesis
MSEPASVSLILPAHQEAKTIGALLESLSSLYPHYEMIVVDDGSKDDTARIAEAKKAKVLLHPERRGYGAAIKSGIREAKGEVVVFVDADGQHDPKDVARLLQALGQAEMAVGARPPTADSWPRRFGKKILSYFADRAAGRKIPDFNSGLRALRKEKVLPFLSRLPDGFSLTTTVTLLFFQKGYRVEYLPIQVQPSPSGSKVRWKDFFKTLFLIWGVMLKRN